MTAEQRQVSPYGIVIWSVVVQTLRGNPTTTHLYRKYRQKKRGVTERNRRQSKKHKVSMLTINLIWSNEILSIHLFLILLSQCRVIESLKPIPEDPVHKWGDTLNRVRILHTHSHSRTTNYLKMPIGIMIFWMVNFFNFSIIKSALIKLHFHINSTYSSMPVRSVLRYMQIWVDVL